jgi:REP element-mobilizing transposase RayT
MKKEYIRLKQPHIQHIGQTFSVTIITHDAIPKQKLDILKQEKDTALHEIKDLNPDEQKKLKWRIYSQFEEELENLLNTKYRQEHLFKKRTAALILKEKIHAFDNIYYKLAAYCIMSNHVHLLLDFSVQIPENWDGLTNIDNYLNVGTVVGRIKGGSAHTINKTTGRSEQLWNLGYYDRYIRSDRHFHQTVSYIINNPVKAKIVEKWTDYPYIFLSDSIINGE